MYSINNFVPFYIIEENNKPANNTVDNDTILRRTQSFENDKT